MSGFKVEIRYLSFGNTTGLITATEAETNTHSNRRRGYEAVERSAGERRAVDPTRNLQILDRSVASAVDINAIVSEGRAGEVSAEVSYVVSLAE